MAGLSTIQKEEIRKIIPYLKSKDKELNLLGLTLLRKSSTYRKMKTQTLFFAYPLRCSNIRVSTMIGDQMWRLKHDLRISDLCITMLSALISNKSNKYFKRMFINTAEIF